MHRLKLFLAIFIIALTSELSSQVQSRCGDAALPLRARLLIRKRFPGWRIKLPSDLVGFDKQAYAQDHPKECPGIAVGHFEDPSTKGYGLLLIPIPAPQNGSKIVVLSEDANSDGYSARVLAHSEDQPGASSGLVLSKVPPGRYPGFDTTQAVRLKLDGLEAEWLEKSSVLYYWRNGKYRTLQTSD
jgi:hypothetical protein